MIKYKIINQLYKIINHKYFLYFFAFLILVISITVKFEIVEPLILLFVIYVSLNHKKKIVINSIVYAILILTLQDIYNLHINISNYLIEVLTMIIAAGYILKTRSEINLTNNQLKERIKELNGLINITKILEKPNISFDIAMNKIVKEIPSAWQYPNDTCVRIIYKNKEYKTDNFKVTRWKMSSDIKIKNEIIGRIEVYYIKKHKNIYNNTPFLKEEYNLIEAISSRLSDLIRRYDQEKKIHENRKFLATTLNSIGDAVIVTDKDGSVIRMNYVAEKLTGWKFKEAIGQKINNVFKIVNSKTREPVKNPVKKVFEQGGIVGLANHTKLISKDGTEHHIADSAAPITDEDNNIYGVVMVFRDFTEEYNLNEEIKRREKIFSNAIKEAPYPLMIHAEDGEVLRINDEWTNISGYTLKEIYHVDIWFEKAYKNKKNNVKKVVDNLFSKNRKVHDGEFEIITKEGQKRIWDFSSAPLGKTDDNRKLIMSMAVDVTERNNMIKNIKKINRLYSILSDINQTIVREKNQDKLLSDVCNIITNKGNYKSVWIGKVNKDNNEIQIKGAAGINVELINGLKIDLIGNSNDKAANMIEKTFKIKTGTFANYINDDIMNHQDITFSNDQRSIAIFPLIVFNKLWGILTICIDQEIYFDNDEIGLFKELTGDLSFAVEALENEKLRFDSEKYLIESEKKYRNLFEKAPIGIFKTSSNGKIKLINPKMANILGYDNIDDTIEYYNDLGEKLYVDSKRREKFIELLKERGFVDNFIYQAYDKNNNKIWIRMDAKINDMKNDGTFLIDGFAEDITEQYNIERELIQSEEKYRSLFENQDSVMLIINPNNGRIVDANNAACEFYKWDYSKLTSMKITEINLLSEEDIKKEMGKANDEYSHRFQFKHRLADGLIRDVEVFSSPIKIDNDDYLFSIIHDITERRRAEEKIIHLSFHDKLTGLYNRAYIEEEMRRLDTKRQLPISIIMGDLNNLKLVNDTYGHEAGDKLIKSASEIIKKSCRSEDIIARWGGDEYVVLLPDTSLEEAEKIIYRINQKTQKQDKNLLVSIALGCASKDNVSENVFKVLNRAESRMYKNKITNRKSARSNVLSAFLNTLREKSFETENHARRMEKLCLKLGKEVGLSSSDMDRLSLLTSLHDIGKVTISQKILNKTDKLTENEWKVIKGHTEAGYRIVSTMDEFSDIAEFILYHHERWDGSGYPEGISGEEIPLLSRILSLVDAYDVMISGRPYKKPMSVQEVKEEIKRCSGSQFDPNLTKIFLNMI